MQKKILILGGTLFTGRVLTQKLLNDERCAVTLFNRGKTNAPLFPEARKVTGERDSEIFFSLANKDWDAVIDFSGYYPKPFETWLNKISAKTKRYIFVSTISVFDFKNQMHAIRETDETLLCSDEQMTTRLPAAYGEKKAEMERMLLRSGMDVILLRPSFISGRYDYTQRFYHWVYRVKMKQPFLFPVLEDYNCPITLSDDLASTIHEAIFMIGHEQAYHVISKPKHTVIDFIKCAEQLLGTAHLHRIASSELQALNTSLAAFPLCLSGGFEIDCANWLRDFSFDRKNFECDIQEIIQEAEIQNWPEPKSGIAMVEEKKLLKELGII